MENKKVVLRLDLHDDKAKKKALKTVSSLIGLESISMDMKEKKLTVIGYVDPVVVVSKLRKSWHVDILTVGPAKEPEKKKDEPKKDEGKKDEGKKDEDKKKEEEKQIQELIKACKAYNPYMNQYYYVQSVEENPNACVIC